MLLALQPTLDGDLPQVTLSVWLRPDWNRPGYWRLKVTAHRTNAVTEPPLATDAYTGLTFAEASDVIEATLRSLPI